MGVVVITDPTLTLNPKPNPSQQSHGMRRNPCRVKDRQVRNSQLNVEYSSCFLFMCRYILPSLSRIPNDEEEWMRVAYAAAIGPLATVALKFLDSVQTSPPTTSEALVSPALWCL